MLERDRAHIDVTTGEVVFLFFEDEPRIDYPCFDDYLLERLNDTIENQ